jgi:hypothetical protein
VLLQNDTIDKHITLATVWWWQRPIATVILSSNGPDDITYACCYCGPAINKLLRGLCKPKSLEAFSHAAKISRRKFPWSPRRRRPPRSLCHCRVLPEASTLSSSPPRSLCTIVPDHGWGPYAPPSSLPKLVTLSTTQALSPSPRCHSQAHNNVIFLEPVTLCTPCCSWARHADDHAIPGPIVSSSSSSSRCLEPVTPSNLRHPWARNTVVLPKPTRLHCIFFFVILGLQILILICYIATLLLFCCIALMCYITTLISYTTLPLTCHITLICYIAFDTLHCFDMLHCHIAQWWNWAKWDECDNMEQHYCTIKISASNNMQQIGHSIKLKFESI